MRLRAALRELNAKKKHIFTKLIQKVIVKFNGVLFWTRKV